MAGFAGYIATLDSIVMVTDSKLDVERTTTTHKINDHITALIFYGIPSAIDFCDKFLKKSEGNINTIVEIAKTEFTKNFTKYLTDPFSLILMSYHENSPVYYGLWIDENKPMMAPPATVLLFSQQHNDLAKYLINKVYSPHMSIEDSTNLIAYVTLQCSRSFPIGFRFEITTVSVKGVKQFTDGEVRDLFQKMEKTDVKLKKIFSDFFISEMKN